MNFISMWIYKSDDDWLSRKFIQFGKLEINPEQNNERLKRNPNIHSSSRGRITASLLQVISLSQL